MRLIALAAILSSSAVAELIDHPEHGVRLERGFEITQFADEKLANDIWCMTINPRGEVVVSGPGYVSTLLDADGDGKAEKAVKFASTKGAMGLCFDDTGKQLLVMADGWLSEYRDENLDRVADGPARKILPFSSGEHGGHAIKRGPDGWWWVIGGNDAGLGAQHGTMKSTGKPALAGALLRLSPDLSEHEVMADGFRNPYDFDFNERGEAFTYDSDCERDYFLPWYSGCRVYHVALGRHHGWRLPGYQRSLRVPDYMPETVPAVADLGRGSPTGVVCYRGDAFPQHYGGNLFICDWTFGRIHHVPLIRDGDRYVTQTEIFLEPVGTHGFAPTSIVQTKDGALLVSIGGRKTRGSVYRIGVSDRAAFGVAPALLPTPFAPPPAALAEIAVAQEKLGGWKLNEPSAETFAPYEPANPDGLKGDEKKAAFDVAQRALLSLDDRVQIEASRLLAMLEDSSPVTASHFVAAITEKSTPTSDFHFLACLARLNVEPESERAAKIAAAILDLDRKLAGGDRRPKQQWPIRLNEVVARLIAKDPELAELLTARFSRAGQLALVDALPAEFRRRAAERFLQLAKGGMEWSPELVATVALLPEAKPLLRAQWENPGLRPALRKALQQNADPADAALTAEPAAPAIPQESVAEYVASLDQARWEAGDAGRGEKVFRDRACVTCHAGTSPLGPELSGPVARLSPVDLMTDIQFPSRNIAEAFRATVLTLNDGTQRAGFIAFNSADGVMLQTGPGVTERISNERIVEREVSSVSLMPAGLLSGMKVEDLADLYAYLKTLKP